MVSYYSNLWENLLALGVGNLSSLNIFMSHATPFAVVPAASFKFSYAWFLIGVLFFQFILIDLQFLTLSTVDFSGRFPDIFGLVSVNL